MTDEHGSLAGDNARVVRVNALLPFGFTERQARFLVTVMAHSGSFLERQRTCAFTGTAREQNSPEFVARLVSRLIRHGDHTRQRSPRSNLPRGSQAALVMERVAVHTTSDALNASSTCGRLERSRTPQILMSSPLTVQALRRVLLIAGHSEKAKNQRKSICRTGIAARRPNHPEKPRRWKCGLREMQRRTGTAQGRRR